MTETAPAPAETPVEAAAPAPGGLELAKLHEQFEQFATVKKDEIAEQRSAWRYYHGAQFTTEQLQILQKRGQPAITFNRIGRKIDGLVGLVERMRGDPKAWPRTPAHEDGAELATECIRTVLDTSHWQDDEAACLRDAGTAGIAVVEISLVEGDQADPDIATERVDPTTFFYDPRSVKLDFSDARFMGVSKWVTPDEIDELFPGKGESVRDALGDSNFTDFDVDRDHLWSQAPNRVRLVEHWYKHKGAWRVCFYAGATSLLDAASPYLDARGRTICRFFPFAANVDHDGDHYGFVRNMKGPQDAMNQHRSKAAHIMNTRQIKASRAAVGDNVEELRREAARPDGVLLYDGEPTDFEVIQPAQEFLQQTRYFDDAKTEIENFGPNPAIVGTGVQARSGRALAMMQQSGVAELGPFLAAYRGWKLRIYRAIWALAQRTWTAQRIMRVSGDEAVARFVQLNALTVDQWGRPALANALGAIDVDIVIDEGPDSVNVMSDVFDTLTSLAQNQVPVPPAVLVEASSLPAAKKRKLIEMLSKPNQAQIVNLQQEAAKADESRAKALKAEAEAAQIVREAMVQPLPLPPLVTMPPAPPPPPPPPADFGGFDPGQMQPPPGGFFMPGEPQAPGAF